MVSGIKESMCGVAGIFFQDTSKKVEVDVLLRMCDRLRHRGPDDRGTWTGPGGGLGHQRLSVIDLTPAGRQPMSNEDGSVWTVYNGEIYNFRRLRRELIGRGHVFRSETDTEVLVHLYEEEGDGCIERLEGMFAFAIWDSRRRRLVLARDRLGKKPLKYAMVEDGIVFASELKAILESGLVSPEVDPRAIHLFLSLAYVPSPLTGFTQIRKLPPAHKLIWQDGSARLERYWNLDFSRKQARSEAEWKQEIRTSVRKAVRRRLVSDVPLGAFLSGGIDSTIVVALMAESLGHPVETFSIGFDYEAYNELPYARRVAEKYRTSHHEFVVRAEAARLLPDLAALYEEPYADPSALPCWLLARETRRFVKVALTGDGGDEGFAGYPRYARLEDWTTKLEWARRSGLHALARRSAAREGGIPSAWVRRIDKLGHVTHPELGVRYGWMTRLFSDREKSALYGDGLRPLLAQPASDLFLELMRRPESGSASMDRMLYTDTMLYLPDDLLVKTDLASMAHGLEARSPLLDHELLELAAAVPAELKHRPGSTKWLLREAFRSEIPHELLDRRKMGFEIPLDDWFRGPLSELVHELLLSESSRVRQFLRHEPLQRLADQHRSRKVAHGHRLWGLLMLELWQRSVVDRVPAGVS